MASTGNVYPTTAANVDRGGTSNVWTNPGNVVSNNTTDATVVVPSDYLVTSGYGFSIPAGATILGVTVRVEASESGSGSSNYIPQLHSATTPTLIGSAKTAVTVTNTTKVVSTSGGAADLWGATLTPAIVNASGFGVTIWSADTVNTLAIDYVTIAIEYLPAVTGTLAGTESGADTAALAGDVIVKGTLVGTESGADTFAASGTVADTIISGALAGTESGADTADIAGDVIVVGALSATETGSDTFEAAGTVLVAGALAAAEEGDDTAALVGAVTVQGAVAAAEEGGDTAAVAGSVSGTPVVETAPAGGSMPVEKRERVDEDDVLSVIAALITSGILET